MILAVFSHYCNDQLIWECFGQCIVELFNWLKNPIEFKRELVEESVTNRVKLITIHRSHPMEIKSDEKAYYDMTHKPVNND